MIQENAIKDAVKYINQWLDFKNSYGDMPGFVVAIQHKDKLVYSKAFGNANLEQNTKMSTSHVFRIASHSKTFTATAIMQLAEVSKLNLDDPVAKHVTWLNEHNDKRWQNVTIRQLLSHSAGVIRDGLDCDYWSVEKPFPDTDMFKAELLKAPLILENNTQFKYSNYGFTLLGLVVESASNKPYNDYVAENIINKLGLKNTGPEYSEKIADKIVTGYTVRDKNKQRLPVDNIDTRAMSSATGFYATAKDLCVYGAAHYLKNDVLISRESKKEMQKVQWSNKFAGKDETYGLGLEIEEVDGLNLVGHGGGFPGQITQTLIDPVNEIVVCVLTNCRDSKAVSINKGIHGIIKWFGQNYKAKTKHNLHAFEGRFMCLWGTMDIVACGDKIIAIDPEGWSPCKYPEKLKYIDSKTLKIAETSGFSSTGELIHFCRDNNKVLKIVSAGTTMLPEPDYWAKLNNKQIVSL